MIHGKLDQARELVLLSMSDMDTLKKDMHTLYRELEGDIRNVKSNVKQIKPVLKVEDPEAISFIKGILSKHDREINIQQSELTEKMFAYNTLSNKVNNMVINSENALTKAERSTERVENLFRNLGLQEEDIDKYSGQEVMLAIKSMILSKLEDNSTQID